MMVWSETSGGRDAVAVTVSDQETLLADLRDRFRSRRGFSVATLNLDHVVKLRRDPDFLAAYADHSHVTADGNPIVWLAHLAGQRDVALVPGSELIAPVAALAAEAGVPVALLGSTEAALTTAAEALVARHPDLRIVLTLAPPMGFDPVGSEAEAAIRALSESGARLVFLALGAPKQERFAVHAQTALPETGFLSIGAGLDFIAGRQRRAPAWMRAISAEWLWRLLRDPRRLARRYGACLLALPGLTLSALRQRRGA